MFRHADPKSVIISTEPTFNLFYHGSGDGALSLSQCNASQPIRHPHVLRQLEQVLRENTMSGVEHGHCYSKIPRYRILRDVRYPFGLPYVTLPTCSRVASARDWSTANLSRSRETLLGNQLR